MSKCSIDGCEREKAARGWCRPHWKRWRRHGDPLAGGSPRMRNRACSVDGCGAKHDARGYCSGHYLRFAKYGDAMPDVPLQSRIPREGDCLLDDCAREVFARGMCWSHYYRDWRYGDHEAGRAIYESFSGLPCMVDGCGEMSRRRGYCGRHYQQLAAGILGVDVGVCIDCGGPIDLLETESQGRRRRPSHTGRCGGCKRPTNPTTVAALLVRDGDSCAICSKPVDMSLAYPDHMSPSVDHVIPLSVGGPNTPENCALAHLGCNIKKSARVGWTISA